MLEQKDLAAIRAIMKEEISESEKRMETLMDGKLSESEKQMEALMDGKLSESEKQMEALMDRKLSESENLVLEELERTRNILEKQIDLIQKNLDELNRYYRITKLENDNTTMLLRMIDDLSKRVDELEKRTA